MTEEDDLNEKEMREAFHDHMKDHTDMSRRLFGRIGIAIMDELKSSGHSGIPNNSVYEELAHAIINMTGALISNRLSASDSDEERRTVIHEYFGALNEIITAGLHIQNGHEPPVDTEYISGIIDKKPTLN